VQWSKYIEEAAKVNAAKDRHLPDNARVTTSTVVEIVANPALACSTSADQPRHGPSLESFDEGRSGSARHRVVRGQE
jgi:hypothetical protein